MPDEQDPATPQDATPEQEAEGRPEPTQGDAPADEPVGEEDAQALEAAVDAVNEVRGMADSASAAPFDPPEFGELGAGGPKHGIDLLSDVHMNVRIELGRTRMYVEDVLRLSDGAVVELDKLAGDPVDVFVNDRKVARGEVLVLNDLFCVRISEVVDITVSDED